MDRPSVEKYFPSTCLCTCPTPSSLSKPRSPRSTLVHTVNVSCQTSEHATDLGHIANPSIDNIELTDVGRCCKIKQIFTVSVRSLYSAWLAVISGMTDTLNKF